MTPRADVRLPDRVLVTFAAFVALVVLIGFSPTFYLAPAFRVHPTPLHIAHGLVMTAWVAGIVAQSVFAARNRPVTHRRVGYALMAVALLVPLLIVPLSLSAAKTGGLGGLVKEKPSFELAIDLGQLFAFVGTAWVGIALRRRRDVHWRLMLLSCLVMLNPALARIPLLADAAPGLLVVLLIAFVVSDTLRNRRMHPALAIAVPVLVVGLTFPILTDGMDSWVRLADRILG